MSLLTNTNVLTKVYCPREVFPLASVVVAADTGPLHMAAALGTPCVGLYGPTSATRNGPYGAGHRTLTSPDGTMAALAPASVLAAVVEALG